MLSCKTNVMRRELRWTRISGYLPNLRHLLTHRDRWRETIREEKSREEMEINAERAEERSCSSGLYSVDSKLRGGGKDRKSESLPLISLFGWRACYSQCEVLLLSLDGLFYTLLAWNTVGDYWNINAFHFKVCWATKPANQAHLLLTTLSLREPASYPSLESVKDFLRAHGVVTTMIIRWCMN